MFTPEFRNRLDAIVPFSYLPPAVVARVVDKFILQLELQLADRNVHIDLDDEAREWLTNRGYDKLYGARPMGRLVQEKIKQPLAEELLFGKLVNGGEVKVRIKDNAPAFEITPAAPKASPRPRAKPKASKKKATGEEAPAARNSYKAAGRAMNRKTGASCSLPLGGMRAHADCAARPILRQAAASNVAIAFRAPQRPGRRRPKPSVEEDIGSSASSVSKSCTRLTDPIGAECRARRRCLRGVTIGVPSLTTLHRMPASDCYECARAH